MQGWQLSTLTSYLSTPSVPELPEVETIVRDLGRLLPGRSFLDVDVIHADLIDGEDPVSFATGLRHQEVRRVTRRAKNIVIELGEQRLVVNLGMTGRLLVVPAGTPIPRHLGVRFLLDDRRELFYHDVRRFGRLQRFHDEAWRAREAQFGIEPLSADFTPALLLDLSRRSRVAVKTWLMDQRRIVGVGNIYASEALFRAGIDPRRPAHSLTPPEAVRLHVAVREVLLEAINFRGTTLLDYRDAQGETGGFAERLRVYDRSAQPCRNCGTAIGRIVQGGRSTFFCPACQR
jgi:formamidopyrimidine-DNA glycosylase